MHGESELGVGCQVNTIKHFELFKIAGKSGNSALGQLEGAVLVYIPSLAGQSQIQTIRFTSFEHLMSLTIFHERTLVQEKQRSAERSRDHGLSMQRILRAPNAAFGQIHLPVERLG